MLLLSPLAFSATIEIWQPGLLQLGNEWQYNSNENGVPFLMKRQMLATETVDGRATILFFEDSRPLYTVSRNVLLDNQALVLQRSIEATSTPLQHIRVSFSANPLEWIPRFVRSTDSAFEFGQGQATVTITEIPSQQWVRTQTQTVTFLSTDTITFASGNLRVDFEGVRLQIAETWRYTNNNFSGTRLRVYRLNRTLGPIEMVFQERNFDAVGNLIASRDSTHVLRTFTSPYPELLGVAGSGSVTPSQVVAGGAVRVNWREICMLNQATLSHTSSVFLSTDTVITTRDTRIATATIPAMAADSEVNVETAAATIPITLTSGSYFVGILADSSSRIQELDEGNNGFVLPTRLTVQGIPDLSVGSVTFSPFMLAPGATVNVLSTIRNAGGGTAPSCWVHVYLSNDTTITAQDYPLFTGIQTDALAPGAQFNINRNGVVPSWFPTGFYYVGILADVLNNVAEISETNNTAHSPQVLTVAMPDLQVVAGSVYPNSVWVGQSVYVQATIRNVGQQTAGSSWAGVYLSADSAITTSDIALVPSRHLSALSSGSIATLNENPIIPLVSAGYYYIGVYCDVAQQVAESSEANNGGVIGGPLLIKTSPPDLKPINFDVRPKAIHRSYSTQTITIALSGFITNVGGAPTTRPARVDFYASPNRDLSPPRYFLCESTTAPLLSMGQLYGLAPLQRTLSSSASLPSGIYTVAVAVDVLNAVTESDENNNSLQALGQIYINRTPPKGPAAACRWERYR